jgi:hypothetical protein
MVHRVSECFPTSEQKQKEIKITRENKKKTHKPPKVLECSCCLVEHLIAQVDALDRTQG